MIQDLWYKNAIIYSLDVKTFMDTNGDGIGDFEGLIRKMDYLASLGVDCLWLSPFQPTPDRDNGYDISDFYGVDPRFGSSGDFVEFMHEARERGIRVIFDLVLNHTSDQHPWFKSARSDKDSQYRNWYVWSKKKPKNSNEGMVFPGSQKTIWTYDKSAGEYYYHRFYDFQPDLNFENPEVLVEAHRIIGFWLQLGVAGFRVDAVPFIIESTPGVGKRQLHYFEKLYDMRRFIQWRRGDGVLLGEANILPSETPRYFGPKGEGIHLMFNFQVNQRLFYALACADTRPLKQVMERLRKIPEGAQWANFLRNHDELDLGRLTPKQRERVYSKFAPEKDMQLYDRGIRRRLAPMIGNRPQIELANSLLFSLPGTPVLRYGDEIGMGDDLTLNERDSVRTPMQWSSERNGGFSTAKRTIRPVISEGIYDYRHVNVEDQRRDPASLLNWTVSMIRLRKECPEIGWGIWKILPTESRAVLAIRYDWRESSIVVVHNFSSKPQHITLFTGKSSGDRLMDLIDPRDYRINKSGRIDLALESFGYKWFRLGEEKNPELKRHRL